MLREELGGLASGLVMEGANDPLQTRVETRRHAIRTMGIQVGICIALRLPRMPMMQEGTMSWHKPQSYISVAEYLESEAESAVRHEYVDGQMYAMAGASDRHNRIALNLASRLNDHLNGGPCEVFIADIKVLVDPAVYYYPDVVVTCDPPGGDPYVRTQPRLIIEVVSPATERTDRHEKLFAYQRVLSLQEYVLVLQDRLQVEVYRRQGEEEWTREIFAQPEDHVHFASVGYTLRVSDIYRNVRWSESATD